jgi:hypothetical protein
LTVNSIPKVYNRPSASGMGDFVIENPRFGRLHYDIKTNYLFFQPNNELAIDFEVTRVIKEIKGKNCQLLIYGSHQNIERIHNLRNILSNSNDPLLREIQIVHPNESLFERGISEYLKLPENINGIELLQDKARFLTDSSINSGEDLSKLVSDSFKNGIQVEMPKDGFHKGNEIANSKLGSVINKENPWHIDEMNDE